jgi:hypothetical protein
MLIYSMSVSVGGFIADREGDPEGRLQPHARQRPGQRPARRGVDELRMFRYPIAIGGGTPFLPPVIEGGLMELGGLEPPTSWVRSRRSPN